jgi:hypothetical protein
MTHACREGEERPGLTMQCTRRVLRCTYIIWKKELFLRAAGASLGNSVRYFHFGLRQSNFETASAPPPPPPLQVFPPAALCLVFGTRTPNHSPPAQSSGGGSAPDLHFFPAARRPEFIVSTHMLISGDCYGNELA